MKFKFTATIWKWPSKKAPWYFITVPKKFKEDIKAIKQKGPWGSISIKATIGEVSWKTMITPAKEHGYIIPIKKDIRKKADVDEGEKCKIEVET